MTTRNDRTPTTTKPPAVDRTLGRQSRRGVTYHGQAVLAPPHTNGASEPLRRRAQPWPEGTEARAPLPSSSTTTTSDGHDPWILRRRAQNNARNQQRATQRDHEPTPIRERSPQIHDEMYELRDESPLTWIGHLCGRWSQTMTEYVCIDERSAARLAHGLQHVPYSTRWDHKMTGQVINLDSGDWNPETHGRKTAQEPVGWRPHDDKMQHLAGSVAAWADTWTPQWTLDDCMRQVATIPTFGAAQPKMLKKKKKESTT